MRQKSKMAKICVKFQSYVLTPTVSLFCTIRVLSPHPATTLPTGAERR